MKTTYIYIGLVVLIIVGLVVIRNNTDRKVTVQPSKYDDFAVCLGNAGAKFYGAWWCPHCKEQKTLFEESAKLPYTECSTPDGKNQLQACIDEKITGYPTWIFKDGERVEKVMQLSELSDKTSCALPQV